MYDNMTGTLIVWPILVIYIEKYSYTSNFDNYNVNYITSAFLFELLFYELQAIP